MRTFYFLVCTVIAFSCTISQAFADEWYKLGSRKVNFKTETDTIAVGAKEGRFTSLRFDIDRANVEMYDIIVTFGNGEKFSPKTRIHFKKNSLSRSIDLPGEARIIKKVKFLYRSKAKRKNRFKKAKIDLFGKRKTKATATKIKKQQSKPKFPGWKHVGSRKVSQKAEMDKISVIEDGKIRSLRFAVTGGAIEVYNIRVYFGNGESMSPKTKLVFTPDTISRDLDLPGKRRTVTKIEFFYRGMRKASTIHVFGKR